jgi:hypothetical protein
MNMQLLYDFFECCVGQWTTERTYHYLVHQEVERSRTEFTIAPISLELKQKVLEDNHYGAVGGLDHLPGFRLAFETISETGDAISQSLCMLFVPKFEHDDYLEGDYLRDRAYEEAKPIVAHFRYRLKERELVMTTRYMKVVSVDSITLISPTLRIRQILNYKRPPVDHTALDTVLLAGFGVEQKHR